MPNSTSPTSSIVHLIENLSERLSIFTHRWIPDSWIVCMMLTIVAIVLAIAGAGAGLNESILAWGNGMW